MKEQASDSHTEYFGCNRKVVFPIRLPSCSLVYTLTIICVSEALTGSDKVTERRRIGAGQTRAVFYSRFPQILHQI